MVEPLVLGWGPPGVALGTKEDKCPGSGASVHEGSSCEAGGRAAEYRLASRQVSVNWNVVPSGALCSVRASAAASVVCPDLHGRELWTDRRPAPLVQASRSSTEQPMSKCGRNPGRLAGCSGSGQAC